MCGRDGNTTTRLHRRREADLHSTGEATNAQRYALDEPLPIASPLHSWQPRELRSRTPQHLVTLSGRATGQTWSAPPLFWRKRYLIAPTVAGQLLCWDLARIIEHPHESRNDTEEDLPPPSSSVRQEGDAAPKVAYTNSSSDSPPGLSPFCIHKVPNPNLFVETNTPQTSFFADSESPQSPLGGGSSLIALNLAPTTTQLGTESQALMVGISVVGIVHVFRLKSTSDTHEASKHSLEVSLQHSWSTGLTGMQCAAFTEEGLIVIGYNSGHIEAWALKNTNRSESPNQPDARLSTDAHTEMYSVELVWRAAMDHAPVIRSVIELRTRRTDVCNDSPPTVDKTPAEEDSSGASGYLVLTLQTDSRTSSASMIEVVNTSTLRQCWIDQQEAQSAGDRDRASVPLENHCILPQGGMEIVNSSTLPHDRDGLPPKSNWIPSNGTDCLCSIPSSSASSDDVNMVESCGAALADGTVVILSASSSTATDGELEWGIRLHRDQLLLSYPAIGMGIMDYSIPGSKKKVPHMVCCLRGGTTYLVPTVVEQGQDETPKDIISVVMYPHDIDSDIEFQRLQFFSAGEIAMLGGRLNRRFKQERIPALIYAWPGGIIDVYAAELLQETGTATGLLLQELVSNGSVELLRKHLSGSRQCPPKWKSAQEEIQAWSPIAPLSLSDLSSNHLRAFRCVLLSLGEDE